MMKQLMKLIIPAFAAIAMTWSLSANALLIEPNAANEYDPGENRALNAGDVEAFFGTSDLALYYKAEVDDNSEEGPYQSFYSTAFTGDPNDALITWVGPDYIVCPECYLVVKDGDQPQYLFNIGGWNGQDELDLTGFYLDHGAISHVAIFGKTVAVQVPEPGTLGLLGLGMVGLMTFRRKTQKNA